MHIGNDMISNLNAGAQACFNAILHHQDAMEKKLTDHLNDIKKKLIGVMHYKQ